MGKTLDIEKLKGREEKHRVFVVLRLHNGSYEVNDE